MNLVFLLNHPKVTKKPTSATEPIIEQTITHGKSFGTTGPKKLEKLR